MHSKILSGRVLAIVAVLFLALHVLAGAVLRGARVDLTANDLYTLTQGSKNIVRNLEEPITLRLYYSQGLLAKIPFLKAYATRVRELLEEYAAVSGGNLRLEVVDPAPFSEEEDRAVQGGLTGLPLNAAGTVAYFGLLATNATDGSEAIPFFDSQNEAFLEYDLTRLIHKLSDPARPVVGLYSPLPLQGGQPPMFPGAPPPEPGWFVLQQLEELFEVRTLEADLSGLDELAVLLLVHPKGLSQSALYAIDQFVLRGGKALLFVDPHCEEDQPPQDPGNPLAGMGQSRASDLGPLLDAWGLQWDPNVVLGDRSAALVVTTRGERGAERVTFVPWLAYGTADFDSEDPVTANLGSVRIASAGILRPTTGATTTFRPLLQSSDDAMEIEAEKLRFFPDAKSLLREFAPSGVRYAVAARLDGPCASAFPDGPPPKDEPEDEAGDEADDEAAAEAQAADPDHLAQSSGDIHVVVVADADLLADKWWVNFADLLGTRLAIPEADNASLVANALDNLSGSSDLIGVRSRGRFERPFHKLEAIRLDAEQKYLAKAQEFEAKLRATEQQLTELQRQRDDKTSSILTPEQAQKIEQLQEDQLTYRKELRAVKHDLAADIERLKGVLNFVNILGIPLLMGGAALGTWIYRRR